MILRTALILALICASSFAGTMVLIEDPSVVVLDPGACLASSYRPWLGDSFASGRSDWIPQAKDLPFARMGMIRPPALRGPGMLSSPLLMLAPDRELDRLVLVPLPPAAEAGLLLLACFAALGLIRRVRGPRKG